MTRLKMELKLRWIALAMLMLAAGAAWAVEDGYQVEIGEQGQFVSGQGTGYGQGTWYLYRVTNWWNQWFYNAPYNPDRKKIIEVHLTILPRNQQLPGQVEIAYNWSTGAWSRLGNKRPPLPDDVPNEQLETKYIARYVFKRMQFPSGQTQPILVIHYYEITDYNPEWVSIDVRGTNVVVEGTIKHECVAKGIATGACCLPDGTCVDLTSGECRARDGEPQGPYTSCATGTCPQPTEACCFPDGTCLNLTPGECRGRHGVPEGPGTSCATSICPLPTEACCLPDGTCFDLTPAECRARQGVSRGPGTDCMSVVCPQPGGCGWNVGDPHKMHFPQLPDPEGWGVDVRSDNFLADDWRCTKTGPVNDIHFWYSWWQDKIGIIDKIHVSIYSNVPASHQPGSYYSKPGEVLWERDFKPDQFSLCYWGNGDQGFIWENVGGLNDHKQIFQCSIVGIGEPFIQQKDSIYWLGLSVTLRDPAKTHIGWKTSKEHFMDVAVYFLDDWVELRDVATDEALDLAFVITGAAQPVEPKSDLGDAPDSSNTVGPPMTAYPKGGPAGVVAKYPTVYQAGSPAYGPIHWQPLAVAYLGQAVSLENEADVGADQDGVNNLVPVKDTPDLDKADDGLKVPLVLPHCELTSFDYRVTVVPLATIEPPTLYVNVWFDWNRDGDWNDTIESQGADGFVLAPEWAVQNQELNFVTSGQYDVTTPQFMCWNPVTGDEPDPIWMRITLSEQKRQHPTGALAVGGSGPANGYEYGETEDYYFVPEVEAPPGPKPPAEHLKWSQPPIEWSPMMRTPTYCGWDEPSFRRQSAATPGGWKIVADDFRCLGDMPVTSVHWWGSYKGWDGLRPPQTKPIGWLIAFWSNVPAGGSSNFSHPGKLLWQVEVRADRVHEERVGIDRFPQKPSDTCFQYYVQLKPEEYFWQNDFRGDGDSFFDVFWISITALYGAAPEPTAEWGWKTRPWHWMDDAVTFELNVADMKPGMEVNPQVIRPITNSLICEKLVSYDMAFELDTDPNYVKWEQAFTGIRDWPHYEDEESLAVEGPTSETKWVQNPDLTLTGVDVDATTDFPPTWPPQILGDDFKCKTTGPITGIDIWGSWYHDVWSENHPAKTTFVVSIRADIPASASPTGHSMPGQVLWRKEFGAGQFTVTRQEAQPESYYSPCKESYEPQNHKMVYKYSFRIDPKEAFVQKGTPEKPTVYWLCVQAKLDLPVGTEATRFGWKTSIDHWNDDAVWARGQEPYSGTWKELRYPSRHPDKGKSIDLAFAITTERTDTGLHIRRLVADDWKCQDRTPVTAVAWWGSYIGYKYQACHCEPTIGAQPAKPDYFLLSIWTDIPDPNPNDPANFSRPGKMIWTYKAYDYDEVLVGYDKHPESSPVDLSWPCREPVFRYSVQLPQENWFSQKNVDDVYWLSIVAVYKNAQAITYPWGWTNHKCTLWEPAGHNMVLHWKLDETAGTIAKDDSGKNNDGTLVGDPTWQACCGRTCGALDLDGDGDYVKVNAPTGLNFAPGSFSASAWINARKVAGAWRAIMEYDRDGQDLNRFGMWLSEEGRFHFRVGRGTGYSNQKLVANQWYLLTGVYDSTSKKMSLYVNGQFDTSADLKQGFTKANVAKLTVGVRGSQDGEYFDGLIDDVRIYNYALGAGDVKALFASGRNDDAVAIGASHVDLSKAEPELLPETLGNEIAIEELCDQVGMSEDMSFVLFTEPGCFPRCNPKYLEWLSVGKPDCWCYARQCHGDADGKYEGTAAKGGIYYVGIDDLIALISAWQVKEPPFGPGIASVPNGICADFSHDAQGTAKTGLMRVGTRDLGIMVASWFVKEPPKGHGVPPDCLDCPK